MRSRPRDGQFGPTRWTLVCAASRSGASPQAERALEELCRQYWYPLYAYVRRCGHGAQEAEDLTQEFFARLLARNYLHHVDRGKGKFRSFLLAGLKHFLANEWDRARAQKRGGGERLVPLNAETRYEKEAAHALTPDRLFDRQWALTLLDQVLTRLREESVAENKTAQFDELKIFLTAGKGAISYADAAARIGTTEGAAKVAVHRLRKRYRKLLRDEIAQTVNDPAQVEEEIRALFASLES
jgi:RNA polymerase sigma factor (sigma-70 family)